MIIRETPIDNAWYRASGVWFIALSAINCLAWPVLDYYKYDLSRLWWIALSLPAGSVILCIFGKFFGKPQRVLLFASIIGLFGIIPLLVGSLLPIFVLLLLPHESTSSSTIFIVPFLFISAYWIFVEIQVLRENMTSGRFIEREIRIEENSLYLSRTPTTDLDARPASNGPIPKKLSLVFPTLVFLLPTAYPLQRLFFNVGGVPAVVLLLSILGTPLAIYILGRTACGFYLWIYTIRKLELEHHKPVMLEQTAGRI